MRLLPLIIFASILLVACGNKAEEDGSSSVKMNVGSFSGILAGSEYTVDVKCSYIDKDYFQFLSDSNDATDSNGDGLIVSGMQHNGKFILTINDNGKSFSVGNLSSFSKSENAAEGSGKLYEEGTSASHDVSFSVDCG